MTSAAPSSIATIPGEVLTRALTFLDWRSLAPAGLTCRRWCNIIRAEGSAPHWRALVAASYPHVEAAMGSTALPLGGWWTLLLHLQDGRFWWALLAARYPSVEATARGVPRYAALSEGMSPMTDIDTREAAAIASACRGDGPVTIWGTLLALQYAAAAPPSAEGGWRGLFLHTERVVAQFEERLNGGLAEFVQGIRDRTELYGLSDYGYGLGDRLNTPLPSPGEGTTARAAEAPDASGAYSSPVYYDWGENLELVKELVPTPAVQAVLEGCVNEAFGIDAWDEGKLWPFFFNERGVRCRNGVQDQLMRLFLPLEHVGEMNGRYADWFLSRGEAILTAEHDPVSWIRGGLETGGEISEEGFVEDIEHGMSDNIIGRLHHCFDQEAAGRELQAEITEASEGVLYREDSSVDETLLFVPSNSSRAFLPLNYILAQLLSPEDAQLRVYVSGQYSVVIDERRNILFDNNVYFRVHWGGMPASVALERSMGPQLPPTEFDYSLGGLVTP